MFPQIRSIVLRNIHRRLKKKKNATLHDKLVPKVMLQGSAKDRQWTQEVVKVHGLVIIFYEIRLKWSILYCIHKRSFIIIQNAGLEIESIRAHFHND